MAEKDQPIAEQLSRRIAGLEAHQLPAAVRETCERRGSLGLDAFIDAAVADPAVRELAGKIRYEIDPANPYPRAFTGHVRLGLRDGRSLEERQSHLRGGAQAPLTRGEIEEKLAGNARGGGWTPAQIDAARALAKSLWRAALVDLADLRG